MTFNAGDVVILKSGGQPLTVASVSSNEATCLWIGEEGDLFREVIPFVALTTFDLDGDDEDEEHDEDGDEDEDDTEDSSDEEGEDEPARRERITA